jgi:hypothetical protein
LFWISAFRQRTLTQLYGDQKEDNEIAVPETNDEPSNTRESFEDNAPWGYDDDVKLLVEDEGQRNEGEEQEDDQDTVYVKEREVVDKVNRFKHRKEGHDFISLAPGPSRPIWDSVLDVVDVPVDCNASKPGMHISSCTWDRLFSTAEDMTDQGLDDLLHLFQDDGKRSVNSTEEDERISLSMLSQGAQIVAEDIVSTIMSKKESLEKLQRSCPVWKENISFALQQKDPQVLQEALRNVRESRNRMEIMKEKILDAWESQNAALEVFEAALCASAKRLKSPSETTPQREAVEFICSQESVCELEMFPGLAVDQRIGDEPGIYG